MKPMVGGQMNLGLDQLADELKKIGVSFDRIRINTEKSTLKQIENVVNAYRDPTSEGLAFTRTKTTTVLEFYEKSNPGKRLTQSEIMKILRNTVGLEFEPDAKTLKRIGALINEYQFGAAGAKVGRVNAMFFDPMQTVRVRDMLAEVGFSSVREEGGYSYSGKGRSAGDVKNFLERTGTRGQEALELYGDKQKVLEKSRLDKDLIKSIEENYREFYKKTKAFANITEEELLNVGQFMESKKAATELFDGAVIGSANFARKVQMGMERQIAEIDESLQKAALSPADPEYIRAQKNIESIRRNISQLRVAEESGGMFQSLRVMNYTDIADEFLSQEIKDRIGQAKGNITIIGESKGLTNWNKTLLDFMSGYGGDIRVEGDNLVNAAGQIINPEDVDVFMSTSSRTMEFTTASGSQMKRMGPLIGMENLKEINQRVFLDPQMMFADPELYNIKGLQSATLADAAEKIAYIESDKIFQEYADYKLDLELYGRKPATPKGILGSLIEASNSGVDDQARREAKQMLELLDEGIGPKQNPMLAELLLAGKNEYLSQKSGHPRLLVPAVVRSEISTVFSAANEVTPGSVSYARGKGFRLSDWDYYKYNRSGGGFDLDDAFNQHMAWDRGSDSLISINKRAPGALGESAVLNIDLNDQLADEVLEHAAKVNPAAKAHMDAVRLTEARIKAQVKLMLETSDIYKTTGDVLSQNLESMRDVDIASLSVNEMTDEQRIFKRLIDTGVDFTNLEREAFQAGGVGTPDLKKLEQELLSLRLGGEVDELSERGKIIKGVMKEARRVYSKQEVIDLAEKSIDVGGEAKSLKGYATYTDFQKVILEYAKGDPTVVGETFEDFLAQSLESPSKNQGVLGDFSNFRMVLDSSINTLESEGRGIASLEEADKIRLLFQEEAIDAMTKQGGTYADAIRQLTNEGLDKLADLMARGELPIDKAIIENEFGPSKLRTQWVDQIMQRINQKPGHEAAVIDDYLIEGKFSELMRGAKNTEETIQSQFRNVGKSMGLVKALEGELFDLDIEKEADEILQASKTAFGAYDPPQLSPDGLETRATYFGDFTDEAAVAAAKTKEARREFSRQMMERGYLSEAGDNFEMTERGRRVVGSIMQRQGSGALPVYGRQAGAKLLDNELGDVFQTTLSWFNNLKKAKGGQVPTVGATGSVGKFLREEVIPSERTQKVAAAIEDMEEVAPGRAAQVRARAARDVSGDVASAARAASKPKRINLSSMKELFEVKPFRRGAIAIGGLVAFSAVYQKVKDRTPEDLSGPPLLPGGSFYSGQKTSGQEINPISQQSGQSGVTYRVRATGDFNSEEFSNSMSNLTGADVKTSDYKTRGYQRKRSPIEEAINGSFR